MAWPVVDAVGSASPDAASSRAVGLDGLGGLGGVGGDAAGPESVEPGGVEPGGVGPGGIGPGAVGPGNLAADASRRARTAATAAPA